MASSKAGDAAYNVEIPRTAKMLREVMYSAFFVGDHTTHFYVLGAPDFIVGPDAPKTERNILGVVAKVGKEIGGKVIKARRLMHEVMGIMGGTLSIVDGAKEAKYSAVNRSVSGGITGSLEIVGGIGILASAIGFGPIPALVGLTAYGAKLGYQLYNLSLIHI